MQHTSHIIRTSQVSSRYRVNFQDETEPSLVSILHIPRGASYTISSARAWQTGLYKVPPIP